MDVKRSFFFFSLSCHIFAPSSSKVVASGSLQPYWDHPGLASYPFHIFPPFQFCAFPVKWALAALHSGCACARVLVVQMTALIHGAATNGSLWWLTLDACRDFSAFMSSSSNYMLVSEIVCDVWLIGSSAYYRASSKIIKPWLLASFSYQSSSSNLFRCLFSWYILRLFRYRIVTHKSTPLTNAERFRNAVSLRGHSPDGLLCAQWHTPSSRRTHESHALVRLDTRKTEHA
ncbi:hypothetical protein F5I97DRAFT_1855172 [Phlebopus sp. FC_14]|nr:hypothetical protein F5I97DRAFT_1855172 [Phlebopus sp. FC_14]